MYKKKEKDILKAAAKELSNTFLHGKTKSNDDVLITITNHLNYDIIKMK